MSFLIRRQTRIRTTAPMTALMIWPYHMDQKDPVAPILAEQTDDDVPDESAFLLDHEEPGQPAGDGSEEQGNEDVHNIGY